MSGKCPCCGQAEPSQVFYNKPPDGRSALEFASRSAVHDDPVQARSAAPVPGFVYQARPYMEPMQTEPTPPPTLTHLLDLCHKEINRLGDCLEQLEQATAVICRPDSSSPGEVPCKLDVKTELECRAADIVQRLSCVCDRVLTLRNRISL